MKELFTMSGKELLFYNTILKSLKDGLKQVRAAELLGVSERHYRRLLKAYKEHGIEGLISKKRGQPSNNRINKDLRKKVIDKLKNRYTECGPTFAWEKLIKNEGLELSHETVRKIMIEEGLWKTRKRKRLKLYQSRQRRACEGDLIQMDGSPHAWFEDRGPKCCLLGFIDDATSKIKHLKFVESETTSNYFLALKEYMLKHGKPKCFYSDRFSVFRVNNDKEGYRKQGLTQVGRALKELEVQLICANSPQAKGRIERLFKTLQDRLIKEMRLRNINTVEEANNYLEEYIKEHNALFAITAENSQNTHRPATNKEMDEAFCYKEERILSKNLELSYYGQILQIKTEGAGYGLRKAKVMVKKSLSKEIKIEYRGRELAYKQLLVKDHQGKIMNKKEILMGGVFPLGGKVI